MGDRPRRAWRVAAFLAAALCLGVLADVGFRFGQEWEFLFTIATPWVVLAFGTGRFVGRPLWSVVAGAAALTLALLGYYAWLHLGRDVALGTLTGAGYDARRWLGFGVVVGGAAGVLGWLTRSRIRLLAELCWCGIVAIPLVDATFAATGTDSPAALVVGVLVLAATGLAVWAVRAGARWQVLAVGALVAVAVLHGVESLVLERVFGLLG